MSIGEARRIFPARSPCGGGGIFLTGRCRSDIFSFLCHRRPDHAPNIFAIQTADIQHKVPDSDLGKLFLCGKLSTILCLNVSVKEPLTLIFEPWLSVNSENDASGSVDNLKIRIPVTLARSASEGENATKTTIPRLRVGLVRARWTYFSTEPTVWFSAALATVWVE